MTYELNSTADHIAVRFAYLYLLGRNPESDHVVSRHADEEWTIGELKNQFMSSEEYVDKNIYSTTLNLIKKYLKIKYEGKSISGYNITDSYNQILLTSNSDDIRYKGLLRISSHYNKIYANKHNLHFETFIGIKRGCHPHHAMYNKAHILDELINRGYNGWVIHIDADAIFSKPNFQIRKLLSTLRSEGKVFAAHLVHPQNHVDYRWWNINNGFFAIDLSSNIARDLAKAWAGVYKDLYSKSDYIKSTTWNSSIINDQRCLWEALIAFEMQDKIFSSDIQGENGFITQALRPQHSTLPTDEIITKRELTLNRVGQIAYANQNF